MMRDPVAVFYGGYDQVARVRPTARAGVRRGALAIAAAAVVLLALLAADANAYASSTTVVRVTSVSWYTAGVLLTNSSGFTLHPSQVTTIPLVCELFCYTWVGAQVSAPFALVAFSQTSGLVEYTNITLRAPAAAYDGPIEISLELSAGALPVD